MRVALHDVWGCAHGPVSRLAPQTRIVVGASVFAACMVAPVESCAGNAVLAGSTIGWLAACRTPLRITASAAAWGLEFAASVCSRYVVLHGGRVIDDSADAEHVRAWLMGSRFDR